MDKEWRTTPANKFLAKFAHNDRKITIKCPWNSCKNQQEMLFLNFYLLILASMYNTLKIWICLPVSSVCFCTTSLELCHFFSPQANAGLVDSLFALIIVQNVTFLWYYIVFLWMANLESIFFDTLFWFSTTWSQHLFWIQIQNNCKLMKKFCIKLQTFWKDIQVWVV